MSGAVKAAIIIGLAVVVLIAVNVRMYRAMKAATAKGRALEAAPHEDRGV